MPGLSNVPFFSLLFQMLLSVEFVFGGSLSLRYSCLLEFDHNILPVTFLYIFLLNWNLNCLFSCNNNPHTLILFLSYKHRGQSLTNQNCVIDAPLFFSIYIFIQYARDSKQWKETGFKRDCQKMMSKTIVSSRIFMKVGLRREIFVQQW